MQTYRTKVLSHWCALITWVLLLPILTSQTIVTVPTDIPSLTLTQRQLCDLELLLNEGFAPLNGFMDKETYDGVVNEMRLPDGSVWPMPIVLDVSEKNIGKIQGAQKVALLDLEGTIIAVLTVSDIWQADKKLEAEKVFGTTDKVHPGVDYLFNKTGEFYVGGEVTKVVMPKHYDFLSLRKTPAEIKAMIKEKKIKKMVGFQTRNPMHRAHLELTLRAAKSVGAHLLLHPAVGMTKPGDVDHFTRVKCYQKLLNYYPEGSVTLSLLPISMRMAGPREALWHALIRKNYGCTHFIVGRDHAGPGKDSQGKDFYGPYDAQELVKKYSKEIGIKMVPFKEMVYVKEDNNYQPIDEVKPGKTILNISGTELRKMLHEGAEIPDWFSFPDVVAELRKVYPPRSKQGFTVFLTGLPAAGKSTIANALAVKLMEIQHRPITLLDGDLVRIHLSSELGFSKEHRSLNVRRVGFVSSEITKNGGVSICALIAPFEEDRRFNRSLIGNSGGYVEVYLSTPAEVCETRDPKGRYAKARRGELKGFTGVDDPYEAPKNPEIAVDTSNHDVSEVVEMILNHLKKEGFIQY